MKVSILHAALAAIPCVAQADCPVRENLAQGIRFTLESGETERFRDIGKGIVESHFEPAEGEMIRVLLAQGLYLLEVISLDAGKPVAGSRVTYAYAMAPAEMPLPDPGGSLSLRAVTLEMGEFLSQKHEFRFGEPTEITYGDCRYQMIPVTVDYLEEPGAQRDVLHYLPALGLSYLAASSYDGQTDTYGYKAIEALP